MFQYLRHHLDYLDDEGLAFYEKYQDHFEKEGLLKVWKDMDLFYDDCLKMEDTINDFIRNRNNYEVWTHIKKDLSLDVQEMIEGTFDQEEVDFQYDHESKDVDTEPFDDESNTPGDQEDTKD